MALSIYSNHNECVNKSDQFYFQVHIFTWTITSASLLAVPSSLSCSTIKACKSVLVSLFLRFLMVLLFLSVYLISWFDLKIMLYRGAWRPAIRFWYHTYWNFGISFGIWSPTPHIPQNPHFLNIVSLILLELMTWLKAYIEEDLKLPKIVLGVKVASDCTENPPNAEEK